MNPKQITYGVIIVVLIGVAVWQLGGKGESTVPDTKESMSPWMCVTCGNVTELTARGVQKWINEGRYLKGEGGGDKKLVFKCDKCGTHTVCRGEMCGLHNKIFVFYKPDGTPVACPDCEKQAAAEEKGG